MMKYNLTTKDRQNSQLMKLSYKLARVVANLILVAGLDFSETSVCHKYSCQSGF